MGVMMERMLLATGEISDQATITGFQGVGDLLIGNLKKQSLQEIYRVMGDYAVIDVDLGAAKILNMVAIMGHSGSSNAFARLTASATNINAPSFDTGNRPFRSHQSTYGGDQSAANRLAYGKNLYFEYFEPQAMRYLRMEISDPGAEYIDMGRIYASHAFQPSFNMVYGFAQGILDGSQEYETTSGDSVSLKRKKRRYADLTLQDLSEDEVFAELYPLDNLVGTTGDVLFVPKPDEKEYLQLNAIYGKIEQLQPNAAISFDRFSRQYRIKELLP